MKQRIAFKDLGITSTPWKKTDVKTQSNKDFNTLSEMIERNGYNCTLLIMEELAEKMKLEKQRKAVHEAIKEIEISKCSTCGSDKISVKQFWCGEWEDLIVCPNCDIATEKESQDIFLQ